MIQRHATITKNDLTETFKERVDISKDSYDSLLSLVDKSNSLYLESSILEDCILNKYLKVYNEVKNIEFNKKLNYIYTDSFLSEDYFDKDFHVDSKLNVDILNGDLVLPIESTSDLKVASVIVENKSNGSIGDSLNSNANNNITDILTEDASKLFIYEKITSTLTSNILNFNITLKLDKEEICNSVYLKLYNDENTDYPKIESIKISKDGTNYTEIENINNSTNKADSFIRFHPSYIRYISIALSQSTYNIISTNFGSRYRYMIGIRSIVPKKVKYSSSGEYVSKTLSVPKNINSLQFTVKEIANSDIKYYMSANNGSVWSELNKNTINIFDNTKLGIDIESDIESLRLKVLADKENIKFGISSEVEYLDASTSNTYYLKNTPISIEGYIGNHISYGNKFPYIKTLYSVPASGNVNILLDYIPYSSIGFDINNKVNNLILEIDGQELSSSFYTIEKDIYPNNCKLIISSEYIKNGSILLYYKPLVYQGIDGNKLTLPQNLFYNDLNSVFIYSTDINNNTLVLQASDLTILDKNKIMINESSYNNKNTYTLLYSPELKIDETINIDNSSVSIPTMKSLVAQYKIRFDYSYETEEDQEITKYYTPICKEFKVEYI